MVNHITQVTHLPKVVYGQRKTSSEKSSIGLTDDADKVFKEVKRKFTFYAFTAAIATCVSVLPFVINQGLRAPAKVLQVVGDFFGSIASVSALPALVKNELDNQRIFLQKANGTLSNKKNGNGNIFDKSREVFYRCCSLGFTPFIFEPFVNPDKFGKSVFHKVATFVNIPNLLFTGYSWGFGNFQALIAWALRERENDDIKAAEARKEGFDRIYNSAKRLATLGSIANPTMQGIRQAADSLALIFKQMTPDEFFKRPVLGVSRLVSLFVGIPEYFIKLIDSTVRVLDERKHLVPVLPDSWNKKINNLANSLDSKLVKDSPLKWIRHRAEILFHTLSPLSMFALFTPMLDEPYTSEEAQSKGGLAARFDKTIGTTGKLLTIFFTGSYVLFARLPQTIMQIAFYGKKFIDKRFYGKESTKEELENFLKNKIANSTLVNSVSNWARKSIDYLVENYYTGEHQHSHLNFQEVLANDCIAQAKEEFKHELKEANKRGFVSPELERRILNYCLDYAAGDATKSYHDLSQEETSIIVENIKRKLQDMVNHKFGSKLPDQNKPKVKPRFPGAYFLATYIFRLFNIKDRILNTDCASDYRNMKTVYRREELDYSFETEILPVITECIQGLRRTVNLTQGILTDS